MCQLILYDRSPSSTLTACGGHIPYPIGIHEWDFNKCVPGCRFYAPTGRLIVFDILEDYRGYQKFDEVWQAYKELEAAVLVIKGS